MRRAAICAAVFLLAAGSADAANTCDFDISGAVMRLAGDCTTDTTIVIPDGFTLDGAEFTITAIDPVGGHFRGAIVTNAGFAASIVNTVITTQGLADVCDGGPSRLRGIFFDRASGTIRGNTVTDIAQGPSRCQEGNAIEVRSLAGNEEVFVEIDHNQIEGFQKTGIAVTGEVDAWVHENVVGESSSPDRVPANGIQIGYGAWALVQQNRVAGNSSAGVAKKGEAATGILLFHAAPGTTVSGNSVEGNADIGIYVAADGVIVEANEVVEEGADPGGYDVGIGDYGTGNRITGNIVRGYRVPYDSIAGSAGKTVAALR